MLVYMDIPVNENSNKIKPFFLIGNLAHISAARADPDVRLERANNCKALVRKGDRPRMLRSGLLHGVDDGNSLANSRTGAPIADYVEKLKAAFVKTPMLGLYWTGAFYQSQSAVARYECVLQVAAPVDGDYSELASSLRAIGTAFLSAQGPTDAVDPIFAALPGTCIRLLPYADAYRVSLRPKCKVVEVAV